MCVFNTDAVVVVATVSIWEAQELHTRLMRFPPSSVIPCPPPLLVFSSSFFFCCKFSAGLERENGILKVKIENWYIVQDL